MVASKRGWPAARVSVAEEVERRTGTHSMASSNQIEDDMQAHLIAHHCQMVGIAVRR